MTVAELPRRPGTYVLVLRRVEPARLDVGRLGRYDLPAGRYAYVGSARGPGGLAARVARHLRGGAARRWHIDHLRAGAEVTGVLLGIDVAAEHRWAGLLAAAPGARTPVPRFGASDCRCATHLVHFTRREDLAAALAGLPGQPGAALRYVPQP